MLCHLFSSVPFQWFYQGPVQNGGKGAGRLLKTGGYEKKPETQRNKEISNTTDNSPVSVYMVAPSSNKTNN